MRRHRHTLSLLLSCTLLIWGCAPRTDPGPAPQSSEDDWASWSSGAVEDQEEGEDDAFHEGGLGGHEVCDGWDNDGDGQLDEDTDGELCTVPATGGPGETVCSRGELLCLECEPGATRTADCGCATERVDLCSPEGRWVDGACDSCEKPVQACACNPGEEMIRRCDDCSGEDCGATCVGARYLCGEDCQWQQLTACEAQVPQCMGDTTRLEQCGFCGSRELVCDGCFWSYQRCEDQGACMAGEQQKVPCFDGACAEGLVTEITCSDWCEWSEPGSCQGCAVGAVEDTVTPCVPGYQCGTFIERQTCVGSSTEICGGDKTLVEGSWVDSTVGVCDIECVPGQTEFCALPDGRAGERPVGCDNTCHLTGAPGACGASSGSCVPGTVVETVEDCGCGATKAVVRTCRSGGDGWSTQADTSQCPECRPGDSDDVNCTTSAGQCGRATKTCNSSCSFGPPQSCQPRSDACTPGESQTSSHSCGANTCGANYQHVRRCRSDGCGWEEFDDRSSCPACGSGETRDTGQLCVAGVPACGTQRQFCTGSCQWENQPCGSCD